MTSRSFYEEGSKLLTPAAFEFVLDGELKRAVRSQNFLTLVVVEASREWEGMMVTADAVDGRQLEAGIEPMLANEQITYIHVHFAKAGCYAAVIERK